jgi:hypothetical protein
MLKMGADGQFQWLHQFKQFTFEVASTLLTAAHLALKLNAQPSIQHTTGGLRLSHRGTRHFYGKALHARRQLLDITDVVNENRRRIRLTMP